MSVEKVRSHFRRLGREVEILECAVSSATVELAAQAFGVPPEQIAKTLSFRMKDGGCLLLVAAGDAKIDNKAFKAQFQTKAKMLTPPEVEAETGHTVGGVCPFALPETGVWVYLDVSLQRFETVFPAAGSAHSAIPLTCAQLYDDSGALGWVDVCKGWQKEEADPASAGPPVHTTPSFINTPR
jgi:prolyl-tRNA editing enzyme YbaK/EbsC (Cys-tRNA(Pro) deacylase)